MYFNVFQLTCNVQLTCQAFTYFDRPARLPEVPLCPVLNLKSVYLQHEYGIVGLFRTAVLCR